MSTVVSGRTVVCLTVVAARVLSGLFTFASRSSVAAVDVRGTGRVAAVSWSECVTSPAFVGCTTVGSETISGVRVAVAGSARTPSVVVGDGLV